MWFGTCYVYLIENVVKPLLGGQPDQSIIDGEAEKMNKNLAILNDQLGKTKYLAGDNLTIADIRRCRAYAFAQGVEVAHGQLSQRQTLDDGAGRDAS